MKAFFKKWFYILYSTIQGTDQGTDTQPSKPGPFVLLLVACIVFSIFTLVKHLAFLFLYKEAYNLPDRLPTRPLHLLLQISFSVLVAFMAAYQTENYKAVHQLYKDDAWLNSSAARYLGFGSVLLLFLFLIWFYALR